jgi:D-alanyl-D-alanine carboxypeptidase
MNNYLYYQFMRTLPAVILLTYASVSVLAQGFSPHTQARLQKAIDNIQNDPAYPYIGGMSAAVKVEGLAFWQGATGYAARNVDEKNNLLPGGTPFTVNTLSQIYSITKTFTAPLVLELVKEGVFGLEDPVTKFLPLSAINQGLNGSITIRQLLAHQSGISDYVDEVNLQIAVAFQPAKVWTPFELISFTHQVTPPGENPSYSSTNYIILGAIIEAKTGKPVEQHYRERFFNPLRLQSMYLSVREPLGNRGVLASPHDNISPYNPIFTATGQPTFPDTFTNVSRFPFTAITSLAFTGGGIVSDVRDLTEWGSALFNGRATSRSTLNTMLNSISSFTEPDGDRLGYGIFTNTKISETDYFVGHNGRAPGYQSSLFYQPDKKVTLAVLSNFGAANPYIVSKALYEAIPDFTCGNKKTEENIQVCFKGKSLCVPRSGAAVFISFGAYLGACDDVLPYNLTIKVQPNPTSSYFVVTITSTNTSDKITLKVYNIFGNVIETRSVSSNQVLQLGGAYRSGIYYLQAIQGEVKESKLVIKL